MAILMLAWLLCLDPTTAYNLTLIGGANVPHEHFPEVVYLRSDTGVRCSGTIIGPRVILTAAHCVKDGGKIWNANKDDGQPSFYAQCKQTVQYSSDTEDLDFALCKNIAGVIENGHPATVARLGVKLDEKVLLTGYGCTDTLGQGGNNGVLKVGNANVWMLPRKTFNWFVTEADNAALCFGDSGSASFRMMDPLKDRHVVLGVNSRGNIKDISLMTATYLTKSRKFMTNWSRNHGVKICGLNLKCKVSVGTTALEDEELDGEEDDSL